MKTRAKTLVFDLDGTLVHSAPDLHAALNLTLADAGRPAVTLDQVTRMIGDGVAMLVSRGFEASGGPSPDPDGALDWFSTYYGRDASTLTTLYPGVRETLDRLRDSGHRMAVCTNKPAKPAMAVLEAFGLTEYFAAVAGGDTFPVRKPSPGHLLGTLAMMQSDPEHAVMVGDSPSDVQVALNAAVPVIAVAYGYRRIPAEDMGADILIDTFDQIPDALLKLGLH
ncbi:MAG: phosphoglycolate phosphatase [Proteobacteria bacterium]|nr:phosphoglycolate phosphatase [Pseudomonadota bacterium]